VASFRSPQSAATPFTTIYFDHHNFVEVTETPQKIITAGEDWRAKAAREGLAD
jgi:hypothetical protein